MTDGDAFDFVDGGRTYACHQEAPRQGRPERWWWFAVGGDATRYAPFPAAGDDTESSVRARIIEYYEARLARRIWAGVPDRGAVRAGASTPPTFATMPAGQAVEMAASASPAH